MPKHKFTAVPAKTTTQALAGVRDDWSIVLTKEEIQLKEFDGEWDCSDCANSVKSYK